MNYLYSLLYASFALLALFYPVQGSPRTCIKEPWDKDDIDYCKSYGKNHIACNDKGKWSKICGKVEFKEEISRRTRNLIVRIHNEYRNTLARGKLTNVPTAARMFVLHWDGNLAYLASIIMKQCNLDEPEESFATWNARYPGHNAALSMFRKSGYQEIIKILKSHLKKWYDQQIHITYKNIGSDKYKNNKEMAHVKQMAIGLNSRIGCAIARFSKKGWMFQLTVCLYGCRKKKGQRPYAVGKYPGEDCVCGVGSEFKYLCHPSERVDDCDSDCETTTRRTTTDYYDEEEILTKRPKKKWGTLTGKMLEVLDCLRGLCDKNRGFIL